MTEIVVYNISANRYFGNSPYIITRYVSYSTQIHIVIHRFNYPQINTQKPYKNRVFYNIDVIQKMTWNLKMY